MSPEGAYRIQAGGEAKRNPCKQDHKKKVPKVRQNFCHPVGVLIPFALFIGVLSPLRSESGKAERRATHSTTCLYSIRPFRASAAQTVVHPKRLPRISFSQRECGAIVYETRDVIISRCASRNDIVPCSWHPTQRTCCRCSAGR